MWYRLTSWWKNFPNGERCSGNTNSKYVEARRPVSCPPLKIRRLMWLSFLVVFELMYSRRFTSLQFYTYHKVQVLSLSSSADKAKPVYLAHTARYFSLTTAVANIAYFEQAFNKEASRMLLLLFLGWFYPGSVQPFITAISNWSICRSWPLQVSQIYCMYLGTWDVTCPKRLFFVPFNPE